MRRLSSRPLRSDVRQLTRSSTRLVVDSLERRRLLCGLPHSKLLPPPTWSDAIEAQYASAQEGSPEAVNIVWTNRLISDNFAALGSAANAGRAVVDAVITYWEKIITSWNRADGTTTLQVNITMTSDSGFGGAGGPANTAPVDGKPRTGSVTINRGDVFVPNNGWHLDPDPLDFAEYDDTIVNAFAGLNSYDLGPDLFSLVSAELAHVLGLISDRSNNGADWQGYRLENYITSTGIRDDAEGGGNYGFFYAFDGPTIDHLLTSYSSGDKTSSSWGNAIHSAGRVADISFAGKNWRGSEDTGNASYGDERTLPSYTMAHILKDAYGYSIVSPETFGTMYVMLDSSTGNVIVRGGDDHLGFPNSDDTFYVSVQGADLVISVDIPNDVPGTYSQSGAGDFPAWTTRIPISQVNTVNVNAKSGDDDIYIYGIPDTVNVVVNGGPGNDFIQIGNGDIDDTVAGVQGNVTVNGSDGTDTLSYFDFFDNAGSDTYLITSSTVRKAALTGILSYAPDVERLDVSANPQSNNFDVNSTSVATSLYLFGYDGDDRFTFDVDFDTFIDGFVSCSGGTGADQIDIDDSADTLNDEYLFAANHFEKITSGAGVVYASSSTEDIDVTLNGANNTMNIPQISSFLSVTVRGGNGNDVFSSGNGDLDSNMLGPLLVFGDAGSDSLTFDDTAANSGTNTAALTSISVQKGTMANYVVFGTIESCVYDGSQNGDVLTMTSATNSWRINGNGGADDIDIVSATAVVTVVSGAGNDTLQVNSDDLGTAFVRLNQNETLARLAIGTGGDLFLQTSTNQQFLEVVTSVALNGELNLGNAYFLRRAGAASVAYYNTRLVNGYNGGTWFSSVDPSITSSLAGGPIPNDTLGMYVFNAARSYAGLTANAGDLGIAYTINGDINLDRAVNFDDLLPLAQSYGATTSKYWFNGDFDYDGDVDFVNLLTLAQQYGNTLLRSGSQTDRRNLLDELTQ